MLFSHKDVSNSLPPHEVQYCRLPCPSLSPRPCSSSCPLSQWCHPAISSSAILFSSCPQSIPSSGFFFCFVLFLFLPMSFLFTPIGISIRASASSLVPPMNIVDWLVGSPCSSRDSQKSSQAPQFKNMYSSMLSLVYGWTLTSVHDYRKNHSFD